MPYVKKTTRRRRTTRRIRKTYRRRSQLRSTRVSQLSFPDRVVAKLPYAFSSQITSGLSSSDIVWNLNSLFDPEQTFVGHQPRGFDQWSAIYNRYRVFAVSGIIAVRQRAAHGIAVNLVFNNSATALTASGIPTELVRSGPPKITSSNQPPVRIRFRKSCSAITGVTPQVYRTDDRFQAVVSANPAEVICMHQFVRSLDSTTAIDYEYDIKLIYHCEFFDKIDLPLS